MIFNSIKFSQVRRVLLALLFTQSVNLIAQDPVAQVSVKLGGESIQYKDSFPVDTITIYKGFLVKVFIGDSLISIDTTNAAGKIAPLDLQLNKVYRIKCEKAGYVSKITEFSTIYPLEGLDDLPPIIFQAMEITLFELDNGCDFSFLETEPIAKFYFGEDGGYFLFDQKYTQQILIRIKKMRMGITE